jgi:hypothetical protein
MPQATHVNGRLGRGCGFGRMLQVGGMGESEWGTSQTGALVCIKTTACAQMTAYSTKVSVFFGVPGEWKTIFR